jgi:DNA-binding response OmpR family regulator
MPRVLVVEDDRLVYDAIHAAFSMKGGFDVAYAGDGQAALSALAANPPDLALIDFALPTVRGLVVANHAAARNVPVVLMSGYPDVIVRSDEYQFAMLPKPFRVKALVDRFEEVIAEAARLTNMARQEIERGQALVAKASALRASFPEWVRLRDQMTLARD